MVEIPRTEWEPLVGRLILACGNVELFLLQLYWNLMLHSKYDESIKYKNMGAKAKFIRLAVNDDFVDAELRKRIERALDLVIELAHKRNLVAHSPLYMDVYSDDVGNFTLIPSIRSLRDNEKHISFEDLIELNEKVAELSNELQELIVLAAEAACPAA
jgi:hypothetical protein